MCAAPEGETEETRVDEGEKSERRGRESKRVGGRGAGGGGIFPESNSGCALPTQSRFQAVPPDSGPSKLLE